MKRMAVSIWRFYADGFRSMSEMGRQLWVIIIVKLVIFFFVFKLLFFPDILQRDYATDAERAAAVRDNLVKPHNQLIDIYE
ncbi:MAG: DUF4492 domain-containing protein [Muribaculaceae bacterium]|nr:DUF4492 domain-containing protein [Muribaculaceae bacterium]MDE6119048.1 DUF4492 domain-containing protein [Muribaculaceae bacterium]MDE6461479.1 DUF4492 domain-containing protein [Muribaculaceae bacterium]MDE6510307.1 DUF4492 domain-containing protein [Muribaculaceae bacterium]MDE7143658.1 DUF4492 domain-containing protein [Muribaculaceae bacterium]